MPLIIDEVAEGLALARAFTSSAASTEGDLLVILAGPRGSSIKVGADDAVLFLAGSNELVEGGWPIARLPGPSSMGGKGPKAAANELVEVIEGVNG